MNGKIITFYSYKGGVGRTMALANVAFLAALNGKRVLMMDWDLEAPGIPFYFRGLSEPDNQAASHDSEGIVNILAEWIAFLDAAESPQEVEPMLDSYRRGDPFSSRVRKILASPYIAESAAFDFLSAGSSLIGRMQSVSYENYISGFSWADFFDRYGGGLVIQSLREWAKDNYDAVFIDSRTGLADVAGICTMQLPDTVALCFTQNRQNIVGTAKIAAAIRAKRQGAVHIRPVPMRVSRPGTADEDSARAFAIAELTRLGGGEQIELEEDFRQLSIPQAEGVPFYELLAPFAAADADLDVLTLSYQRLTKHLLGLQTISIPIAQEWKNAVGRRATPRIATTAYIEKLLKTEPARALSEVLSLLDGLSSENQDVIPSLEYVASLMDTTFKLVHIARPSHDDLATSSLAALTTLAAVHGNDWLDSLVFWLERWVGELDFILDDRTKLQGLTLLDGLLAKYDDTDHILSRTYYLRSIMWVNYRMNAFDEVMHISEDMLSQMARLRQRINVNDENRHSQFVAALIDASRVRGAVHQNMGDNLAAMVEYSEGVRVAYSEYSEIPAGDSRFLVASLHYRLATLPASPEFNDERATHAVKAIMLDSNIASSPIRFYGLAKAVLDASHPLEYCFKFVNVFLDFSNSSRLPMHFLMVGKITAAEFQVFLGLISTLQGGGQRYLEPIKGLLNFVDKMCRHRLIPALLEEDIGLQDSLRKTQELAMDLNIDRDSYPALFALNPYQRGI